MISAADRSPTPLHDDIQARLSNGTLRPAGGLAWMGTAEGDHLCVCCGATIGAVGLEYEIKDRTALFAHVECFIIWDAESAKLPAKRIVTPAEIEVTAAVSGEHTPKVHSSSP